MNLNSDMVTLQFPVNRSCHVATAKPDETTATGSDTNRCAPPPAGLKPASAARRHTDTAVRRLTRRPETTKRLGRLRRELAKIRPTPSDPQEAREEIIKAMARAGLDDWTVPELSDASTVRHADGSARITLLAHAIIFSPAGAFRIVELHPPGRTYFEMGGQDGHAPIQPDC
ncbi:hypothetical protein [Paraburkholderia sp. CI3]|uniref:hypothetical protein n=1 Tax=Paraburkholderia sp. CI3 TaxID=2991060 RepID=UPI003D23A0F5